MRSRVERDEGAGPSRPRDARSQAPPHVALALALQRGAGNHALARALGPATEPLADGVRRPLEDAFGSSFRDVRVNRASSGAAALGAEALTRGSEIHFAPGRYDPDSAAGRDLVGHELAHVVQQRQGRVAPGLSLDRALESEADLQGHRVAAGGRAGAAPSAPGTGEPASVQAKFGFEFQADKNAFIEHEGVAAVGEKVVAFEDPKRGFKVEGDEGSDEKHFDVEFVTYPVTTLEQAEMAVQGAAALAGDIAKSGAIAKRQKGQPFDTGNWTRDAAIEVKDPAFVAKPQATVGVRLGDIPKLIESAFGDEARKLVGKQASQISTGEAWTKMPSQALFGFLHLIAAYVSAGQLPNDRSETDEHSYPTLGNQVIIPDGPKARFALMARTDFHSMFKSLTGGDQTLFVEGVLGAAEKSAKQLTSALNAKLDAPMIDAPYRADQHLKEGYSGLAVEEHKDRKGRLHPIVMKGPTVRDWLMSIATGSNQGRDLLSAPPGWSARAKGAEGFPKQEEIVRDRVYGMGAFPMDTSETNEPLAVLELRGLNTLLQSAKLDAPPAAKWWESAKHAILNEIKPGVPAQKPQTPTNTNEDADALSLFD